MDFLVDGGRRHVQKENRSFYRGRNKEIMRLNKPRVSFTINYMDFLVDWDRRYLPLENGYLFSSHFSSLLGSLIWDIGASLSSRPKDFTKRRANLFDSSLENRPELDRPSSHHQIIESAQRNRNK
jgi:hypothetical protein